jgi:putative CocE/NonD family hydrolase
MQHWFRNVKGAPKKLTINGPAHMERPFWQMHDEILRWYDYWLKGVDTGIMDEPPIKYWVMGENRYRTAGDWPIPETKWTKYYLHSWERLKLEPHLPSSQTQAAEHMPDAFVQMPPTKTMKIERLRYMTEPLAEDTLVVGPISLTLYAEIDQEDTNWIVVLKDVGPDVSVRTQREGERFVPDDLPERELTRGWLKASHRAVDSERSEPWAPWHPLTRDAQVPVVPGEIDEYRIEILATANMFKAGHRICLDITSLDVATGTGGAQQC